MGRETKFSAEDGFKSKDYLSLGEKLGLIDVKKAAEVSGSRFGYLMNEAALMEFGLVQLAFKILLEEGFIPVVPPVMIKSDVFAGMGKLVGEQKEDKYYLPKDDLYLVGSAEHTLGPLQMNEVFEGKDLLSAAMSVFRPVFGARPVHMAKTQKGYYGSISLIR